MNPYSTPKAKVADQAQRPGSPYGAVALGLLADIGGTIALTNLIAFIYGIALAASGLQQEEIVEALTSASTDSWYFWIATLGGGACSVLGGYVCARFARQSEYTLGAILAVISVLISVTVLGAGSLDVGTSIVLNAATVVCVVLGAWIGKKQNRAARAAAA